MFDGYRLTSSPAVARACSRQHIQGVNVNRRCGRRLIGRLALRRAKRLQPCAEDCANCQARQKLTRHGQSSKLRLRHRLGVSAIVEPTLACKFRQNDLDGAVAVMLGFEQATQFGR